MNEIKLQANRIWALADLHLSLADPQKDMALISVQWSDYVARMERQWDALVSPSDLVLIPGDISWAMKQEEARIDLEWIAKRPGTKILSQGNHDYWWPKTKAKAQSLSPSSIHLLHKDLLHINEQLYIVAAKGAQDRSLNFDPYTLWTTPKGTALQGEVGKKTKGPKALSPSEESELDARLAKEELRLERKLARLDEIDQEKRSRRLVMLHYPPTDPERTMTGMLQLLEKYRVDLVVFGHLHSLNREKFCGYVGEGAPRLAFVAADWLNFAPLLLGDAVHMD